MTRLLGMSATTPQVAVIGGSGFYEFLDDPTRSTWRRRTATRPRRSPSVTSTARRVAFLPRHGTGHAYPPHLINYRANLWALRSLGVRQVLAPCAVGGLRDEVAPGDVVVPDQLVDRTLEPGADLRRRAARCTCRSPTPTARRCRGRSAAADGVRLGGTMVVVEGPRFSTRAESQHYAAQGWSLVNMTGHPEAVLARELQMCYAAIALVTDMDAGVESGQGVGQAEVFATVREEHRAPQAAARRRRRVAADAGRGLRLRVVGGRPRPALRARREGPADRLRRASSAAPSAAQLDGRRRRGRARRPDDPRGARRRRGRTRGHAPGRRARR